MVDVANHGTDSEDANRDPIGLVDVYIPPKRTALIAVLILLVAGWGCVIAGVRIAPNAPDMSRFTWYAILLASCVAVNIAITGLQRLWRRRIRSNLAGLLAQHEGATIEKLIEQTVSQCRSAWPNRHLQALAQLLPSFGRVGITIRNCPPKFVTPIEPITVTFEPRALDEADESVVALEDALKVQDGTRASPHDAEQSHSEAIPEIRRLKRNITLAGGRVVMAFFVLSFLGTVFLSYVLGQIGILLVMGIPLFLLLFCIPGGGWQFGRKQWLLVPGGIVIRKWRLLGDGCRVHLIARKEGVLVVHRASRNQWSVCAANKDGHHEATVTPHEATLLLCAWLSPLPPPPLEQLSDLA